MGKCKVLIIVSCLILILSNFAQAVNLEDADLSAIVDSGTSTITLNPSYFSWPTYNDTGDMINGFEPQQAHFAFDLSSIPDTAKIVSATFSAYFYNGSYAASQRQIWHNSDDSWINTVSGADPGNSLAGDELVGTLWHTDAPADGYVWKTITITFDGWSNDLADDIISFIVTGGQFGVIGLYPGETGYTWGVEKEPELILEVMGGSPDSKVYKNIFNLGPEEIVKADGMNINLGEYSVPSTADWNNDGLNDLIVGAKLSTTVAKVRVYLNIGTTAEPEFSEDNSFFAQSFTSDLICPPSGCLGCFPRVVDWDSDGMKDLIIGQADGSIKFFRNINTDNDPVFDDGTYLKHTENNYLMYIDVGSRATPDIVDWNNDGLKDIVCGALDGYIHIFLNEGTKTDPVLGEEFLAVEVALESVEDEFALSVPSGRSCPVVRDLDFDGKKDILSGNTDGQLVFYKNFGTNEEPLFSGYEYVDSNGVKIDLAGTPRSRQFVCYWDNDGYPDVLVGAYDGLVHLYRCKTLQADFDKDGDIDFTDWAIFTSYWNLSKYEDKKAADLNNDGEVNIDDVSWILANWLLDIKPDQD